MHTKYSPNNTPVIHRIAYASQLYAPYLAVREAVLRTPLGLTLSDEDKLEDARVTSVHVAALMNDTVIGSALCLLPDIADASEVRLRQLAVLDDYRGYGIGKRLVEETETIAREVDACAVYLNARVNVQGFYEQLGYRTDGEIFEKIGIPHIRMRKPLFR